MKKMTTRKTKGSVRWWVAVALALFAILCVWFYLTGLWKDLQFD